MEPNFDAPDFSLQYEKETRGGSLLFVCRGGFSLVNHALLENIIEEIKAAPERSIILDLGGIRFMDSMGIGTLANILKYTTAKRMDFVLVSNDIVDQILGVARMTHVMRIVHNLEEAIGKAAP